MHSQIRTYSVGSTEYRIDMFNFFKIIPFKNSFQQKSEIIAYCGNSTHKVFCTIDDEVQVYLRDYDWVTLHIKHLKFCCIPENSDYLYILSQHPITRKIFLNVYSISTQIGRKTAIIISTSAYDSNSVATAFSAFYLSESQLCLAIGLESGSILFYKNALQKDILLKNFNITTKPIKGIRFSKNEENVNMFVCSDAGIFCFSICSILRLLDTRTSLDDMDSSVQCISFKPSCKSIGEQYLIVARENGLYCYTAEGRGPCYAISGNKQIVEWFGKYLIVVLKTKSFNSSQNKSQVLVYDMDNKIIVLDKQLDEVACLLPISEHTNCLIMLKNGDIYTLREKEMKYKLSCVIKKNLFDLALKLLEESKVNLDISDVLIQYGDYVLQRGDSLGAIKVFTKTIGTVPTFLIIKKLKDFRYNEVLIQYLSNLVQTEFKVQEHSDLLKNCVRRVNLPKSTCRLFEIDDINHQQQYIYLATINHNINITLIMDYLKQEQCFSPHFFYEYSDAEAIKFFSECGYYLIKEYPNGFKQLTKYSLSERTLNNMFQQVLFPLSLINKLCTPYFIDDLLNRADNILTYNILTELILQMWYKRNIDTEFVVQFLKSNLQEVGTDNALVLCRLYNFWPGIKMMYDKRNMVALSNHCLTKCFEVFPEHVKMCAEEYNNLNQMMIQTLTKQNHTNNFTLKYVTGIAKNIISSNPYYILNMLSNFVNSSDILISHLDEFLVQDTFFTYFKCDELYSRVSFLEYRVICIEEVLDNYLRRPIEFRNRSCDICKHVIKQPAIYLLCQHTFHRECWMQLNEHFECIVCADKQNSTKVVRNSNHLDKMEDQNIKNNMLMTISDKIVKIPLKANLKASSLTTKKPSPTKKAKKPEAAHQVGNKMKSKNFCHNEYDDNLNPFMHK